MLSSTNISEKWNNMSHISSSSLVSDLEIEPIARHPVYYIPSGDVIFLVEGHLFRVHRYFFVRESVKFRDMLSAVSPNGTELMGASDSHAILLSDVTGKEFECFLWIYYNDEYEYEAPLEKWAAILRLAHMWQFLKVKALATRKLDNFDIEPVDKAVMAHQYEVDPAFGWLDQAYAAIGERENSISKAEAERLGLDVVVLLADLRERIRKTQFEQERIILKQNGIATRVPPPIRDFRRLPTRLVQHDLPGPVERASSQGLSVTECKRKSPSDIDLAPEKEPEDAVPLDYRVQDEDLGDPSTFSSDIPPSLNPPKQKKVKKSKKVKKDLALTSEIPVADLELDPEDELADLLGEPLTFSSATPPSLDPTTTKKKAKKTKKVKVPVADSKVDVEKELADLIGKGEVDLEKELADLLGAGEY